MSEAQYHEDLLAQAQREVDAAEAAVVKGLAHVAGSREAVKQSKARLERMQAELPEFTASAQAVDAQAAPALGHGR